MNDLEKMYEVKNSGKEFQIKINDDVIKGSFNSINKESLNLFMFKLKSVLFLVAIGVVAFYWDNIVLVYNNFLELWTV